MRHAVQPRLPAAKARRVADTMQAGTLHERDPDHAALREQVWTRVQLARNVRRPHALELMRHMASEIVELHGDRLFRDDPAIVGGLARLDRHRIVFVGHQKGAETDENIRRNFGMPHPEGYRKGIRLFQLAERLKLPVVTIVDTPGAFPGQASEERGVAEAIARSIQVLSGLRTPVVVVITGEGGSGGALALGVGDVVLALENSIYSVISPEGCASILWRSPEAAQDAAVAMRLTAADQAELGVIDQVVAEPGQGAHTDHADTAKRLKAAIVARLDELADQPVDALVQARYGRFRDMGAWTTVEPVVPRSERIGGLAERWGLTDRLRGLLESGRATLTGSVEQPLRPQAGDLADEPPLREEV